MNGRPSKEYAQSQDEHEVWLENGCGEVVAGRTNQAVADFSKPTPKEKQRNQHPEHRGPLRRVRALRKPNPEERFCSVMDSTPLCSREVELEICSNVAWNRTILRSHIRAQVDENLIHVAPAPSLRRIVAFDDRVVS